MGNSNGGNINNENNDNKENSVQMNHNINNNICTGIERHHYGNHLETNTKRMIKRKLAETQTQIKQEANHEYNKESNKILNSIDQNSNCLIELRNCFPDQIKFTSELAEFNAKLELTQFYTIDLMELFNIATGLGFLMIDYYFENNNQFDVFEEFKLICRQQNIPVNSIYIKEYNLRTRLFLTYDSNANDYEVLKFCINKRTKTVANTDMFEIQNIIINILYDFMTTIIPIPKELIILTYQYWVGIIAKFNKYPIHGPYYNPILKKIIHHPQTKMISNFALQQKYNSYVFSQLII